MQRTTENWFVPAIEANIVRWPDPLELEIPPLEARPATVATLTHPDTDRSIRILWGMVDGDEILMGSLDTNDPANHGAKFNPCDGAHRLSVIRWLQGERENHLPDPAVEYRATMGARHPSEGEDTPSPIVTVEVTYLQVEEYGKTRPVTLRFATPDEAYLGVRNSGMSEADKEDALESIRRWL